uniref:NTF2-related export protein n=1 Tax=Rhabditophanes sp. KR3021 TaxID=114890 RepID=A0AC35U2Z0_9BILA
MTNNDYANIDATVCYHAAKFVQVFFHATDSRRVTVASLFSSDNPVLVFNGTPYQGDDAIKKFWADLDQTVHKRNVMNAHLIDYDVGYGKPLHVEVAGSVKLGRKTQPFTATFLIVKDDPDPTSEVYACKSCTYRFLY